MNQLGPTGQWLDLEVELAEVETPKLDPRADLENLTRHHSDEARDVLRDAGLSMNSELNAFQCDLLRQVVEATESGEEFTPHYVRRLLLPSLTQNEAEAPNQGSQGPDHKGESIMAKAKTAGRPKKSAPSKAQVAKVASMRRAGATWDEVIAETGIKTNSTGFRELLEAAGFDKYGRKGGRGETKAKGWGSAELNGKSKAKATAKGKKVRKVKRTKATAKK